MVLKEINRNYQGGIIMLWITKEGASYQVVGCNIHEEKGNHQLWVERPSGKSTKIAESKNRADVKEVKNMIDHAIKIGDPVLELS